MSPDQELEPVDTYFFRLRALHPEGDVYTRSLTINVPSGTEIRDAVYLARCYGEHWVDYRQLKPNSLDCFLLPSWTTTSK